MGVSDLAQLLLQELFLQDKWQDHKKYLQKQSALVGKRH